MKFAPNDGRIKLCGCLLVTIRKRITVGPIWTHKVRTNIPRPSASDRIMVAAGLQGLTPPGSPAPPDYSESPVRPFPAPLVRPTPDHQIRALWLLRPTGRPGAAPSDRPFRSRCAPAHAVRPW